MLTPSAKHLHARSLVYHALAEALYEPEPEAELHRSLLVATPQAAQTLSSPACQKAALALASMPKAATADLRQRYVRVTRNSARRPLALYESLFREGRLMGQATIAAGECYRKAGIATDNGELPDHASVELTFLGYLTEAQADTSGDSLLVSRLRTEERAFLRAHPGGWLPDVGRQLAAADDPFYTAVGSFLSEFLDEELTGSRTRQSKRSGLPVLAEAAECNLCGLCVGTCPLKALGVVENENETALALDVSRCVGCMRCLRGCPQGVLSESAVGQTPSNRADSVQILRRSARAHCPVCGAPTVSQAELDAVFAALQPDPVMERQMSLCVSCKSLWNPY